jgi:hypothetical protein
MVEKDAETEVTFESDEGAGGFILSAALFE